MPCDLGYKSFDRVVVPTPQPLIVKKRLKAPQVDAELMERLGQEDPAFVDWLNELDTTPLLEKALAAVGDTGPVAFAIENGVLTATATCRTAAEKRRAEETAERVGRRWQMEVLAIVAQLLDFETAVTVTKTAGGETLTLEGEKHGASQVHEYLRVTFDPQAGDAVLFEHFATAAERDLVRAKFLALGQKLGVRIDIRKTSESGSPIPAGAIHKHFIKSGK